MNQNELTILNSLNDSGLTFDGKHYVLSNGTVIDASEIYGALRSLSQYVTDTLVALKDSPDGPTLYAFINTLSQI
jgi:hypothetical protein